MKENTQFEWIVEESSNKVTNVFNLWGKELLNNQPTLSTERFVMNSISSVHFPASDLQQLGDRFLEDGRCRLASSCHKYRTHDAYDACHQRSLAVCWSHHNQQIQNHIAYVRRIDATLPDSSHRWHIWRACSLCWRNISRRMAMPIFLKHGQICVCCSHQHTRHAYAA